jgi:hypothetical protein
MSWMIRQNKNNTLNPALIELIKLLAQVAVEDYLSEIEKEQVPEQEKAVKDV